MPPTSPKLLALNGVRLKGFAEADAVALAAGVPPAEVEAALGELREGGLVQYREGRVSGWTLTPAGREEHAHLVAAELAAAGCAPQLEAAYQAFLQLNPRLLTIASAWQMREEDGHEIGRASGRERVEIAVVGG